MSAGLTGVSTQAAGASPAAATASSIRAHPSNTDTAADLSVPSSSGVGSNGADMSSGSVIVGGVAPASTRAARRDAAAPAESASTGLRTALIGLLLSAAGRTATVGSRPAISPTATRPRSEGATATSATVPIHAVTVPSTGATANTS